MVMSEIGLRMMGKDPNGLAQGIALDAHNRMEVNDTEIDILSPREGKSLNAGESFRTDMFEKKHFSTAKVSFVFTNNRKVKVSLVRFTKIGSSNFQELSKEVVYQSNNRKSNHTFEHDIDIAYYAYEFVNVDGSGGALFDVISVKQNKAKENTIDLNNYFSSTQTFNSGAELETEIFDSTHTNFANGIVSLQHDRRVDVFIKYYNDRLDEALNAGYELVYSANNRAYLHTFEYTLKTNFYKLKFVNVDTIGTNLHLESLEKKYFNTQVNKTINTDEVNHTSEIVVKTEKEKRFPLTTLKFKKANIPEVRALHLKDNLIYVVDGNNVLKVYDDLTVASPTPVETGIDLSTSNLDRIVNIRVMTDKSILIFTSGESLASIYKCNDIQSEPILKYQSETFLGAESSFANRNGFGIKSYDNGLNTMVLAAVYGRGQEEQDLLLSTDNGETFNVIKKTSNLDTSENYNSHWHDVAFDIYHGLIWASEGDDSINRNVWWSDNFGVDWHKINPESSIQPTALLPFPDKMIMGRDGGKPGIDVVYKPESIVNYEPLNYEELKTFKPHTQAIWYYAQSPLVLGNVGYMSFNISDQNPRMVLGTGDFGESFHFVFMGYGNDILGNSISGLADMDDEFVYAYGSTASGTVPVLFSKQIKWA